MIRIPFFKVKALYLLSIGMMLWLFSTLNDWTLYFQNQESDRLVMYDRTLLFLTIGLSAIGFIMVTSASLTIGHHLANDPFLFSKRYALYLILAFCLALITLHLPVKFWQNYSITMLIASIIMLLIVLVIGISVNGASRWISFGFLHIQPAEFSKLAFFCYLANYLARKLDEVRCNLCGFLKPIVIILILSFLLLAQPDLGTIIVLFTTSILVLFLAGVKVWQFIAILNVGFFAIIILILAEPYRIRRVTSFLNPWKDPFGSGYQLTQSLMAFGRGEIWGQGLGNSIQKIEYLQEAHTDFIFSIIGEELGYIGAVLALLMIFFIAWHAMSIGRKALELDYLFSGFLSCSIGIWFSLQTLINVGAAIGILPTKGLTLPLISYGGSSLLITYTSIVILLRIDYEMRLKRIQAFTLNLR